MWTRPGQDSGEEGVDRLQGVKVPVSVTMP